MCVFEDGTAPLNTLTTSTDGALGPRHPVPMCRWCRCLGLAPKLAPHPQTRGAPHPSSCLLSLEPDMKGLQTKWGVVIFQQINKVTGAKLFLSSSALCCMMGVVLQNDLQCCVVLSLGKVTFFLLLIFQLPSLSSSFSFTNLHEIMTFADSALSKY